MRPAVVLGMGLTTLAILGALFIYFMQRQQPPVAFGGSSYTVITQMPEFEQVPAFSFLDEAGKPFTDSELWDRWTLLFFGFTNCPDICPPTMVHLRSFVRGLEDPPRVVLVSVDPERDTPEAMKPFVTSFHPDFKGIAGKRPDLVMLSEFFGIYSSNPPSSRDAMQHENGAMHHHEDAGQALPDHGYTINHSGSIMIINPEGHYVGRFSPPLVPEEMIEAWPGFVKQVRE